MRFQVNRLPGESDLEEEGDAVKGASGVGGTRGTQAPVREPAEGRWGAGGRRRGRWCSGMLRMRVRFRQERRRRTAAGRHWGVLRLPRCSLCKIYMYISTVQRPEKVTKVLPTNITPLYHFLHLAAWSDRIQHLPDK